MHFWKSTDRARSAFEPYPATEVMAPNKRTRHPTQKELGNDEIADLLKHFEEKMPAEFRQYAEWAMNPEKRIEAERQEEANKRMEDFLSNLQSIPAGYELPEDFERNWEALLTSHEQEEKDRLIAHGRNPKHIRSFLKRGWITADTEALLLKSHAKKPAPDFHPIPMVLVNEDGHWAAPTILNFILRDHPFVRFVTDLLPELSAKDQILRTLSRTQTLKMADDYHGTMLGQAADTLEIFLHEQMLGDPKEFGWLHDAKESENFWLILDAAIGFGRNLANYEVYGDGSVGRLIRNSLVARDGRLASSWRIAIDELMEAYHLENGKEATAKALLKWMGARRPNCDSSPIVFCNGVVAGLQGITWPSWNETVKSSKKKRK